MAKKKIKLSDKQKDIVGSLRNGFKIQHLNIRINTLSALVDKKILNRRTFKLTELGKTINL